MMMGGNVNQPIATEVDCSEEFDLGKGFKGVIAVSPNGKTYVVETTSGGIVGNSVDDVKADIASASNDLAEQVKGEIERGKTADLVKPDEFWKMMGA
jgi:hypothetical protein